MDSNSSQGVYRFLNRHTVRVYQCPRSESRKLAYLVPLGLGLGAFLCDKAKTSEDGVLGDSFYG